MNISEAKKYLNKTVKYKNKQHNIDGEYILTGCIIRKGEKEFYYEAELKDKKANSLIYTGIENIKV